MVQFVLVFPIFKLLAISNPCIFSILQVKLHIKIQFIFREQNAFYFKEIAFISFTLNEIKQCIFLRGTPGIIFKLKLKQEVALIALPK